MRTKAQSKMEREAWRALETPDRRKRREKFAGRGVTRSWRNRNAQHKVHNTAERQDGRIGNARSTKNGIRKGRSAWRTANNETRKRYGQNGNVGRRLARRDAGIARECNEEEKSEEVGGTMLADLRPNLNK